MHPSLLTTRFHDSKMVITPAMATEMLMNNQTNRKMKPRFIIKMARQMVRGTYTECIAPICFYAAGVREGGLCDGQNRLKAIERSGVPQLMSIKRGLTIEDAINIDTGCSRTPQDSMRIATGEETTLTMIAWTTGIAIGGPTGKILYSNDERIEFLHMHYDACKWVEQYGTRGKRLRVAPLNCALARAWYHEIDYARLKEFGEIVTTGFVIRGGEQDSAAIATRNWFKENGDSHSASKWEMSFLRSQHAIYKFMRGDLIKKFNTAMEHYPLPESKKLVF